MRRLTEKIREKKGFTLAELLIVVAIIAVLVAIAIPIFTTQLEKSKEATDLANVRAAYAEVTATYLDDNSAHTANVDLKSNLDDLKTSNEGVAGVDVKYILSKSDGATDPCVVAVDATGKVTINGQECTSGFVTTP